MNQTWVCRQCLLALVGCLAIVLTGIEANADTSRIGSIPDRRAKRPYVIHFELESVGGNGFQPLHLKVRSLRGNLVRDIPITVEVFAKSEFPNRFDSVVRQSFVLPEGRKSIDFEMLIPKYSTWRQLDVRLLEDGREVRYGKDSMTIGLRQRNTNATNTVGIIVAQDGGVSKQAWTQCPDVRTLITVLGNGPIPDKPNVKRLGHTPAVALASRVQPAMVQFRLLDEASMSDQWLAHSQLDIVLVAAPVLERLEASSPDAVQAIEKWVISGGSLWVYAAKGSTSKLLSTEKPTSVGSSVMKPGDVVQAMNLGAVNDTEPLIDDTWNGIRKGGFGYQMNQSGVETRQQAYDRLVKGKNPFVTVTPVAEIASRFKQTNFGFGSIISISDEDPFPGSFQFWQSVSRWSGNGGWTVRHGLDVRSGSDAYWSLLIGSVGQPPVKSFAALNTLFVLLVGPVAYVLLRRRKRLFLLYFAAPLVAVVALACLFAYALVADGFSTRARVRQVTYLDGRHGVALQQDRATYYTVMGSRRGLVHDADMAVYPIHYTRTRSGNYRASGARRSQGTVAVSEENRRFTGVYLPPRSQVQYLTERPLLDVGSVDFDFQSFPAVVTNQTPWDLEKLVVKNEDEFWLVDAVASGESVDLQRVTAKHPVKTFAKHLPDNFYSTGAIDIPDLDSAYWYGGSPILKYDRSGVESAMSLNRLTRLNQVFVAQRAIDPSTLGITDARHVDSVGYVLGVLQ
ncbi:MAG: hypothetical protein AAGA03_06895 [Planctomycetota bacterium]